MKLLEADIDQPQFALAGCTCTGIPCLRFSRFVVATFLSTLVVPVFYVVMKTLLGQADAKPPEDGPNPTPQPS